MYFGTKKTLKSNRKHTPKQAEIALVLVPGFSYEYNQNLILI